MHNNIRPVLLAPLLLGAAFAPLAHAQTSSPLTVEWSLEFQLDNTFASSNPANVFYDFYGTAEAAITYAMGENVEMFAGLTLEPVAAATANRIFGGHGIYVGELGLNINVAGNTVTLGKFAPGFGTAWDAAPGLYGTGYAEDYELAEMLGIGLALPMGRDRAGTLTVAAFYADTTALSGSLGTQRGPNTLAAGGAGNTGRLDNYAIEWSGETGGTGFNIGARRLARGVGDVADETGYVIGFNHSLSETASILGEVASFTGFGGTADRATYATLGTTFGQGPTTWSASYTYRQKTSTGIDHLIALGASRTLANGTELNFGYSFTNEAGTTGHTIGLAVVVPLG